MLEVNIRITTDTEPTAHEWDVLAALAGTRRNPQAEDDAYRRGMQAQRDAKAEQPAEEEEKPARRQRRSRRKAAEAEPQPEPQEPAEDQADQAPDEEPQAASEPQADEGDGEPTLQDAVDKATALINDGKSAQVKEALAAAGAKKVGALKGDQIATFLENL